jgi:hypothetical protein
MQMAKNTITYDVAESIAAIAMNIGLYRKRESAYRAAGPNMGGFPGFYQGAIEMGIALDEYAAKNKIIWGENADWIQATKELGNNLLDFMIESHRLPHEDERLKLVKASILR